MKKFGFLIFFYFLYFSLFASDETLQVVAPWEIKNLEAGTSGYVFQRMQIGENLVGVSKKGELIPELASGWKPNSSGLVWKFSIRKGILFHDGSKMTAAAVSKSLNCSLQKSSALRKAPIDSISFSKDSVQISLQSPFSILPATLAHYSTIILAPDSYDKDCKTNKLIGTGAYQMDKFNPPKNMDIQAFSNYWKKKAKIKKVSYLAVGRGETRALLIESGDTDIVYTIDPVSLNRLKAKGKVNVFERPIPRTIVIKLNAGDPLLSDVKVRQAISQAIDREGISAGVMRIKGMQANQLFPPILKDWHLQDIKKSAYSPQKSIQTFQELGWKKNEEGYLEKGGKVLQLELITYSSRPILPVIATAIQNQLKQVGVKMEVSIVNSGTIPKRHQDNTLQMALLARLYSSLPDPLGVVLQDYGKNGGDWGAMNWSNPQVIENLEKLVRSGNQKERTLLTQETAEIIHEELPTIPVVYYNHSAIVNKKLKGFFLDPLERSYYLNNLSF